MTNGSDANGTHNKNKRMAGKLRTPYILTSGPLSYAAEGLIRAHNAGCGAVVTKTIRLGRAINPVNHIGKVSENTLINCEKWADSDRLVW